MRVSATLGRCIGVWLIVAVAATLAALWAVLRFESFSFCTFVMGVIYVVPVAYALVAVGSLGGTGEDVVAHLHDLQVP